MFQNLNINLGFFFIFLSFRAVMMFNIINIHENLLKHYVLHPVSKGLTKVVAFHKITSWAPKLEYTNP
jgi:hypothetical protein